MDTVIICDIDGATEGSNGKDQEGWVNGIFFRNNTLLTVIYIKKMKVSAVVDLNVQIPMTINMRIDPSHAFRILRSTAQNPPPPAWFQSTFST
jgi:hypothetical protein